MNQLDFKDELRLKISKLSQNVWENKVKGESLERWLENFSNSDDVSNCESSHALFMLSNFMFFGVKEIRELLKSIYRDKVRIPLIRDIRLSNGRTKNSVLIEDLFKVELSATRFLGMGNPSESGNHLLYFFRQENQLPKELFIHTHEILSINRDKNNFKTIALKNENIRRYIFIDDVCGTGTQATEYSEDLIKEIKDINEDIEVCYFTLFATSKGLQNIRDNTLFDNVDCIFELDDSFRCFSENSRYFKGVDELPISKEFAESFCRKYGHKMLFSEEHQLGYKNGQMLMGFSHNIPDNTLPIIWSEDQNWAPIMKRYSKLSSSFYE
ncbi:MAG: hypothetical protein COB03_12030 [Alteromonas sp.]|nr:MAG: hypothetical protein COB03_12030 [Alteromonas sp.]